MNAAIQLLSLWQDGQKIRFCDGEKRFSLTRIGLDLSLVQTNGVYRKPFTIRELCVAQFLQERGEAFLTRAIRDMEKSKQKSLKAGPK